MLVRFDMTTEAALCKLAYLTSEGSSFSVSASTAHAMHSACCLQLMKLIVAQLEEKRQAVTQDLRGELTEPGQKMSFKGLHRVN